MPPSTPESQLIKEWQRPPCSLSPCPALNSLCNHNAYGLPRDGKNIHARQLVEALVGVYGLSRFFAVVLAYGAFLGVNLGNKHRFSFTLDMSDLCSKGVPHPAPLVHENPHPVTLSVKGRPSAYLTNKVIELAEDAPDVNLQHFAHWRITRERQLSTPISYAHAHIAAGELALLLQIFGDAERDYAVDKETLRAFLACERLPANMRPRTRPGIRSTIRTTKAITRAMAAQNCTPRIPLWTYLLVFASGIAGIVIVLFRLV